MELEEIDLKPVQPTLFDLGGTSAGVLELFPGIWHLLEMVISPDSQARKQAVVRLAHMGAVRLLPLAAYVFATRITDCDLEVRAEIINCLGDVYLPDEQGHPASEAVRQSLTGQLSEMRTRQIYALLQVLSVQSSLEPVVARLLNSCPYAGNQLAEILASRKVPLDVRRQAVRMIGLVGYLEAIPALERLLARLEVRAHGQQSMAFAPIELTDETELIPDIRKALVYLSSP
jgi:HEAT repeat protein